MSNGNDTINYRKLSEMNNLPSLEEYLEYSEQQLEYAQWAIEGTKPQSQSLSDPEFLTWLEHRSMIANCLELKKRERLMERFKNNVRDILSGEYRRTLKSMDIPKHYRK